MFRQDSRKQEPKEKMGINLIDSWWLLAKMESGEKSSERPDMIHASHKLVLQSQIHPKYILEEKENLDQCQLWG